MNRVSRCSRRRFLPYLAAWACVAAMPGCGGEAPKVDPAPKKDNDSMANFMKTRQQGKKKKR